MAVRNIPSTIHLGRSSPRIRSIFNFHFDYHLQSGGNHQSNFFFLSSLKLTNTFHQRPDPYDYPQSKTESNNQYYNGYGSPSPVNAKYPRSPHSHSHPKPDGRSTSPSNKALTLGSPPSRHSRAAVDSTNRDTPTPAPSLPSLLNPEPSNVGLPGTTSRLFFIIHEQHPSSNESLRIIVNLRLLLDTKSYSRDDVFFQYPLQRGGTCPDAQDPNHDRT